MRQIAWTTRDGWPTRLDLPASPPPSLVMVFGDREALVPSPAIGDLEALVPEAALVGCSTAGHIRGASIADEGIVATIVGFERTRVALARARTSQADSRATGRSLAADLSADDLAHVLVFSEGIHVNGSDLARGLGEKLPQGVTVTGGLAADGERFSETIVVCGGERCDRGVVAVGLYDPRRG